MIDLYTPHGAKIRYTGEGGYDYQREAADKIFEVGQVLTVEGMEVGSWSSSVKIDGKWYNTVMFENIDETPPEQVMTNEQLLDNFVLMFEDGEQGCQMDYDDAQALALAIRELQNERDTLNKRLSDASWALNPDRMGGQFTQEEINRHKEW